MRPARCWARSSSPAFGSTRHMHDVQAHRLGRIARMVVAAEAHRIVELDARMERHRRRDLVHAEPDPRVPVAHQHLVVDERRLDVLRKRGALLLRQLRHEVGDHHVEAGEHDMLAGDAVQLAVAQIGDIGAIGAVAHMHAGRSRGGAAPARPRRRAARSRRARAPHPPCRRPARAAGMSDRTRSRASEALPSGKW